MDILGAADEVSETRSTLLETGGEVFIFFIDKNLDQIVSCKATFVNYELGYLTKEFSKQSIEDFA